MSIIIFDQLLDIISCNIANFPRPPFKVVLGLESTEDAVFVGVLD